VDHPLPWLRYVDAGDLDDQNDFDGMTVESPTGERLGEVDGFIVDSASARPYYVVVDAGGWFKSKHFLLPIGHATLNSDTDRDALVAAVPRERIDRFPGFDKSEFEKLTPEQLKRYNDDICVASSVTAITYGADEPYTAAWERSDYRTPDWWTSEPSLPERMGDEAFESGVHYPPASAASQKTSNPVREEIRARERAENEADRESRADDPSPHFDGRAQPGDVIGLETGGERTYIGETREDENKRRRDAEKAVKDK
jgi:hypothetical protein